MEGDLLKRVARLWPRSCHPILLADRGLGTRDLFDLLDGLHGDWIIRSQGTTQVEIHPGVWVPLRALATQPVLRDLSVRYGQSSGDQAYPCRMVIGAEAGYSDPWFLVVSAGLRKATWPTRLITAATGQRFTTEGCFRDQKNDVYEGFQPRRSPMRHSRTLGSDAVNLRLDLLLAQCGRMGDGTRRKRSGWARQYRPGPPDPYLVALGPWGTPGG